MICTRKWIAPTHYQRFRHTFMLCLKSQFLKFHISSSFRQIPMKLHIFIMWRIYLWACFFLYFVHFIQNFETFFYLKKKGDFVSKKGCKYNRTWAQWLALIAEVPRSWFRIPFKKPFDFFFSFLPATVF